LYLLTSRYRAFSSRPRFQSRKIELENLDVTRINVTQDIWISQGSLEKQIVVCVNIYIKRFYYKKLAHALMKAKKSQYL
jgi:predicted alpha/beta hydrolase